MANFSENVLRVACAIGMVCIVTTALPQLPQKPTFPNNLPALPTDLNLPGFNSTDPSGLLSYLPQLLSLLQNLLQTVGNVTNSVDHFTPPSVNANGVPVCTSGACFIFQAFFQNSTISVVPVNFAPLPPLPPLPSPSNSTNQNTTISISH